MTFAGPSLWGVPQVISMHILMTRPPSFSSQAMIQQALQINERFGSQVMPVFNLLCGKFFDRQEAKCLRFELEWLRERVFEAIVFSMWPWLTSRTLAFNFLLSQFTIEKTFFFTLTSRQYYLAE